MFGLLIIKKYAIEWNIYKHIAKILNRIELNILWHFSYALADSMPLFNFYSKRMKIFIYVFTISIVYLERIMQI